MSKLKSAIIGFGSIAQTHVEALKEGNVSKVVAVCDINPDKLESVKEACPGAKAYTTMQSFWMTVWRTLFTYVLLTIFTCPLL